MLRRRDWLRVDQFQRSVTAEDFQAMEDCHCVGKYIASDCPYHDITPRLPDGASVTFTQEDVEVLRHEATISEPRIQGGGETSAAEARRDWFNSLANRVEALLPKQPSESPSSSTQVSGPDQREKK
jgi:hypothetical protein